MTLSYKFLLKECLWSISTKKYLLGQLACYSVLLISDILLVNWYEDFYDSIITGNWRAFIEQVLIFCCIVACQAIAFGLIANLSELMNVSIKIKLVNIKLAQWGFDKSKNSDILEQRLIEDSLLIADKLSNLAPSILFALFKILVFTVIILMHSNYLLVGQHEFESGYILLLGFIFTTGAQIFFASKGKKLIEKAEDIKRRGEFEFRSNIRGHIFEQDFYKRSKRYVKLITSIRSISAKKIGSITFMISLSNSISFVAPFIILFQLYEQNIHSLGGVMKIAAIYTALSNSAMQIFNAYSEVFKLNAAIRRLVYD